MTIQLVAISFNANDPERLASFWAAALGWRVDVASQDPIELHPTDGTRFRLDFPQVPERNAEGLGRAHFDLTTSSLDDQRDTVARLVALGARRLDVGQGPEAAHVVLSDPEGNAFCVIEPDNTFLADCGRLGAMACDGTRAVGYFWSAALGWPLVWDQDEETAIRAPARTGPLITWGGGPITPKSAPNRLHLDVAAGHESTQAVEVDRLIGLGARRIDVGQGEVDWVVMADPDGNEFCVLES